MAKKKNRYRLNPEYRKKVMERARLVGRELYANYFIAREWMLQQLGGACSRCGYNKCKAALDIHHKNGINPFKYLTPHSKSLNYNKRQRWMVTCWKNKLIPDKENLELICANCHRELHNRELKLSNSRG